VYLVYASLNRNPLGSAWKGFTLDWYRAAVDDPSARDAARTSVRLAVGASVGATVLGTAAALAVRRTKWLRRLSLLLAGARAATPEIIIATGLAVMLPLVNLSLGFKPMLVAHVVYLSAYVTLLVGARAAGADASHEEAALDLGASRWQTLWHIVLPDLRPAIVSSLLLAAAFSFDDVALSLALRGPQDTTLPVYLFSAVQRRVTPSIHAIGVMVVLVGALAFGAALVANRATRRGHGVLG
jgi:spermidine/putrescine transport system permease protein